MTDKNLEFEDGYYTKKPIPLYMQQYRPGKPIPDGVCTGECVGRYTDPTAPHVHTLEGDMSVVDYDCIMTGTRGEHWPVKPEIFAETYGWQGATHDCTH